MEEQITLHSNIFKLIQVTSKPAKIKCFAI